MPPSFIRALCKGRIRSLQKGYRSCIGEPYNVFCLTYLNVFIFKFKNRVNCILILEIFLTRYFIFPLSDVSPLSHISVINYFQLFHKNPRQRSHENKIKVSKRLQICYIRAYVRTIFKRRK